MRRRTFAGALPLAVITGLLPFVTVQAAPEAVPAERPKRAILITGGGYARYQKVLQATARGLERLDVIDDGDVEIPELSPSTEEMWQWLSERAGGDRLEFLRDGHYSYEWIPEIRREVRAEVLRRLRDRRDVDIIFTLGTEASQDMREAVDDIPVLSLGSTDPLANGLVASTEDSGKDNFHALVVTDYFDWQIARFHAIFRFRRFGLLAAENRRRKCGADVARAFCRQKGIEFLEAYYVERGQDPEEDYRRMHEALLKLVDAGIDAICLPFFICPNDRFPDFLEVLTKHGIPSFTQEGPDVVARGILLGVGEMDVGGYGLAEARVISSVLDGVRPRSLGLRVAQSPGMVINLKTAMQMGWQPPLGLLVSVEETFSTHSPSTR